MALEIRIGFGGYSIVSSILRLSGVRHPSQEGHFRIDECG